MAQGKRESEWQVIRRCLAIIRRIQQGEATRDDLIRAVLAAVPEAYSEATGPQLHKRFHSDLARIRNHLWIEVQANPRTKQYSIRDMNQPLLALPDTDLKTIAWLEQTFGPGTPHHPQIGAFLERLRFFLAAEQRLTIEQQRTSLVLELGQQDDDPLSPEVEHKLQIALARRQRVEFDYFSPQFETGQARRHVVDIFEPPRFEPMLGHYYVHGWCHYSVGPQGQFEAGYYIPYRLGRIKNLRPLPARLPPAPPPAKRFAVTYWLTAEVARYGVTRRRWIYFDSGGVERQADGSVIVTGATDSPFFAQLELMHYRHNCRVLGGPELLQAMRNTVKKMAQLYEINR
jgi:predicted DNA-binding transcriptional regulator YafY